MMDKETRYHMALGVLNALIYEGSDDEAELRAVMMLLDPQPDDDLEWAEQTASAVMIAWSDSMLRAIHDFSIADDQPAFEDLQMTEEEELGLGKQRRDLPGEDGPQEYKYPCDVPGGNCPFDAEGGMDCRNNCGLGVDE